MTPEHRLRPPVVWIDGSLRDPTVAGVHWSDHGLTVGDGVFETLKLNRGSAFALRRHLDRLEHSARGLRIPLPEREVIERAVEEVARQWGTDPGRLRVTVTAGRAPAGSGRSNADPTLLVTAAELHSSREPADVIVVDATRNERGALVGLKTTSYAENALALALARESGAEEALFANTRGELCEGTGTNIFVARGDTLWTPTLDSGCLAGITRALLLDAMEAAGCPAVEGRLSLEDLREAPEAFLVSTVREVQPIRSVDGRRLARSPGPLSARAAEVWDSAYGEAVDP